MILLRAVAALLEGEQGDDAALREWLPPPSELLRIAEYECHWRGQCKGLHPSLACATLYGERLGDWETAAEVAAGVLRIEAFNPLLRTFRIESLLPNVALITSGRETPLVVMRESYRMPDRTVIRH